VPGSAAHKVLQPATQERVVGGVVAGRVIWTSSDHAVAVLGTHEPSGPKLRSAVGVQGAPATSLHGLRCSARRRRCCLHPVADGVVDDPVSAQVRRDTTQELVLLLQRRIHFVAPRSSALSVAILPGLRPSSSSARRSQLRRDDSAIPKSVAICSATARLAGCGPPGRRPHGLSEWIWHR
jgi:hypothetical protein